MGMPKPIIWSFSRLDKFAQCPKRYQLQYLERRKEAPADALRFGSLLHAVLEQLYEWVIADEHQGPWPDHAGVVELYKSLYASSGITSKELFAEGLQIIQDYLQSVPTANANNVLAVEQDFKIKINGVQVRGFIDRIDRVGDDGVRIVDYKSNRMLYSSDELDSNLQLSIYAMAARHLYPWAKRVDVAFYMLRHNCYQETERSAAHLDVDAQYIETLAKAASTAKEFEPRLGTLCRWCGFRSECEAYQQAVSDKTELTQAIAGDLDGIVEQRQRAADIAKIARARQDELDELIKGHLSENDELEAGGYTFTMRPVNYRNYDVGPTVELLAALTPHDADRVRDSISIVNNKKLNQYVDSLRSEMPQPDLANVKMQLATVATINPTQRLAAKKAKS